MEHRMITVLNNGVAMPMHGLGVYLTKDGDEVRKAVTSAVEAGYRLIDTAAIYRNEKGVGSAVRDSGIARDNLFVTTKVWNSDQGYDRTLMALDASLDRLGFDYVDLYLVHWPNPELMADTWMAMERLLESGRTRAIGVSNFEPHHLDQLMTTAETAPTVNQVELHPHLAQREIRLACSALDVVVQAWSPLKQGAIVRDPVVLAIADSHAVTPAQVVIRWQLQHGIATIPKSVHRSRIIENADVFDFELTHEELDRIDALDRGERIGPHPDTFGMRYAP
jgi:diketogulonate reductase-like aldo/keto reductase